MDMAQMDGALDKLPVLTLDNRQIQLAKISDAQVGQVFEVCATARVVAVSAGTGGDGLPSNSLHLELHNLEIEREEPDPMDTVQSMYPSTKVASV